MKKSITSGQEDQIKAFAEAAARKGVKLVVNKGLLDKKSAQTLIHQGDDFSSAIVDAVLAKAKEFSTLPYTDEEVESSYGYPQGFQILSVAKQVEILLKHFPNLDASHAQELASGELPEGADGWAVIPKFKKAEGTYHEALKTVLNLIAKDRKFKNWREGELTEKYLRLTDQTVKAHATLNEQPGDFWVVPFQFGIKHRGKSVRRARVVFTGAEFGLGAYEVAVLLLTHPDRITPNCLNIDCAGVEYSPDADGDFFACLRFGWSNFNELLGLDYSRAVYANRLWGSASAFLPQ